MHLSDASVLAAKPTAKLRKMLDAGGLYLEVSSQGGKLWRFKYRFEGKEKRLTFGAYPSLTLDEARGKRDMAIELLAQGIDPADQFNVSKFMHGQKSSLHSNTAKRDYTANAQLDIGVTPGSLGALGLSGKEERVYRLLLRHHKATVGDVAKSLSLPLSATQILLRSIEQKGLATHTPERPRRYVATPPEFASELLGNQRQADLDLARLNMLKLKTLVSNNTAQIEQAVEVLSDRNMINQYLRQLYESAKIEIVCFQRAPILLSSNHHRNDIRVRTVSDASFFDCPNALEMTRHFVSQGEEARFFSVLPTKLFIVDRRIALIPLHRDDIGGGARLLIRNSGVLQALHTLFELIWEQATPIPPNASVLDNEEKGEMPKAPDELIALLAMGLNDKAIAQEADISASTIARRIADLMKSYGTRSRFQLGWRAALNAYPERLVKNIGNKTRA